MRAKVPAKPFGKPKPAAPKPSGPRLSVRPLYLYLGFALLLATNALTLVGFLMAPDVAKLFGGQNDSVLTAYEDRIAQLRLEVDRLQSRHYAQTGDINLQLQELAQTQEVLIEQHQYVKQLAEKAAALGIGPALAPQTAAPDPTEAPDPARDSLGSDGDADAKVAAATASVTKMMDDSKLALAALSDQTSAKTDEIMGALATIGIKPKLPDPDQMAEGGPLLPPVDGAEGT